MRILLTFIFQMVRFLLHNVFLFLKSVIYPPLLTQIKSAAGPRICDLCLKSIKYQPHTKSLVKILFYYCRFRNCQKRYSHIKVLNSVCNVFISYCHRKFNRLVIYYFKISHLTVSRLKVDRS